MYIEPITVFCCGIYYWSISNSRSCSIHNKITGGYYGQ